MLKNKRIAIVGLGLIGGSLAKAIRKYCNPGALFAVDPNEAALEMAIQEGVINKGFPAFQVAELYDCDMIFLCTPVKDALSYLDALHGKIKPECILSDVCSTKSALVKALDEKYPDLLYVGGHPMTGRENSGYSNSTADLFQGAIYILTRCKASKDEIFSTLLEIVAGIGGVPVELDSLEHDLSTACISHMPHLVAFTLVDLIQKKDGKGLLKLLAAGGFKDITRVASSDPRMWESIFLTNKDVLLPLVDDYIDILKSLSDWIRNENSEKIIDLLSTARSYRNAIP